MKPHLLLDTGPLVALLDRRDRYHRWAAMQWAQIRPPLSTCEAVLTEACYLLRHTPLGSQAVMELVRRGIIVIPFAASQQAEPLARLLRKYADVPMSLADACLVRMAELNVGSVVLTVDGDFRLYRQHGRQAIPLIIPQNR